MTAVDLTDDMELVETTLDVFRMGSTLQRVLYICALEGALEDGVDALKERGIIADTDTVLVLAGQIREACAEKCFFCEAATLHDTGWLVRPGFPHMPWAQLATVACHCLDKYRNPRITMIRGWELKELQERLSKQYHNGEIDADKIVYTDKCTAPRCDQPFKVTVQNVVLGFLATGLFRGWKRCQPCELALKIKREQAALNKALSKGLTVTGVGTLKSAPRKNALLPSSPEPQLPHNAAHGWGTLGDSSVIREALARARKGR